MERNVQRDGHLAVKWKRFSHSCNVTLTWAWTSHRVNTLPSYSCSHSKNSGNRATVGLWLALSIPTVEWSVLSPHSRNETVNIMKALLKHAAVGVALVLGLAGVATADNLHLCDTNTVCNNGSLTATNSPTLYATGKSSVGDELFLAILVPETNGSGNFNSTTNLWTALGEAPNQVYPTLASAISQLQGATGFTAVSFSASDIDEGAWTGSATLNLPALPANTIIMAFTEDSHGNLSLVTPWSSSFATTPEPSTLLLLGTGLCALAWLASRRSHA